MPFNFTITLDRPRGLKTTTVLRHGRDCETTETTETQIAQGGETTIITMLLIIGRRSVG